MAPAQAMVDALVAELDRAASRFRQDSDLSRLNRSAGRPVQVGSLLAELISVALVAASSTDGLVDPTMGGPLVRAGYDRDFEHMPSRQSGTVAEVTSEWGWRRVQVDGDSVSLPRGMLLDLGATAKAWAADRAVAEITASVGGSALMNMGGDLTTSGPAPPGGWVVRVADDHRASHPGPGQNVVLGSPALATSSITQRRWTRGGRQMHHIIDPRNGRPAEGPWRTVSVAGPTCVTANTASTAAIVLGKAAPDWLAERALPARLVTHSGAALHVGGWPDEGDELPTAGAREGPLVGVG